MALEQTLCFRAIRRNDLSLSPPLLAAVLVKLQSVSTMVLFFLGMCWTDDKGQFTAVHISSRIYVFHFKPALPVSVCFVSLPTLRIPVEALSVPWRRGPGSCPLSSPGFWGLSYGCLAQVRGRWCQNCSTGWELSRVVVHRQPCSAPDAASVHSFYPSFPVL